MAPSPPAPPSFHSSSFLPPAGPSSSDAGLPVVRTEALAADQWLMPSVIAGDVGAADGGLWERTVGHFAEDVFAPEGLATEAVARATYLCQADEASAVAAHAIDIALFVLRS